MQPKKIFIIFFCGFTLFSVLAYGQSITRVEVKGAIYSETNDVEAVTIFNKSSNVGTITNVKGEFKIKVALNDIIEISALQFQTTSITVNRDIIDSKLLKIQLVEEINQLEAVALSSGLSGNMFADIDNVVLFTPIKIDMGDVNMAYEYNDDKAFDNTSVENDLKAITSPGEFYGGVNIGKIFDLIKGNKKRNPKSDPDEGKEAVTDFNLTAAEFQYKNFRKKHHEVLETFFRVNGIQGGTQEAFVWYCLESPEFVLQAENGTDLEVLELLSDTFIQFKQN